MQVCCHALKSAGICHALLALKSAGICHALLALKSAGICHALLALKSAGICHALLALKSAGFLSCAFDLANVFSKIMPSDIEVYRSVSILVLVFVYLLFFVRISSYAFSALKKNTCILACDLYPLHVFISLQ